jgi:hypothetical protein
MAARPPDGLQQLGCTPEQTIDPPIWLDVKLDATPPKLPESSYIASRVWFNHPGRFTAGLK